MSYPEKVFVLDAFWHDVLSLGKEVHEESTNLVFYVHSMRSGFVKKKWISPRVYHLCRTLG